MKTKRHRSTSKEVQDSSIKIKRTRRTKKEMEAFRASLISKEGKDKGRDKKSVQKSNTEVSAPILKPKDKQIIWVGKEDISAKLVEGWINIYRDAYGAYYVGGDIHYTIEDAKQVTGNRLTKQFKIIFEGF